MTRFTYNLKRKVIRQLEMDAQLLCSRAWKSGDFSMHLERYDVLIIRAYNPGARPVLRVECLDASIQGLEAPTCTAPACKQVFLTALSDPNALTIAARAIDDWITSKKKDPPPILPSPSSPPPQIVVKYAIKSTTFIMAFAAGAAFGALGYYATSLCIKALFGIE